ncbi:MAG TPA: methyltransferase domain-containing protein [Gaiellaceae bacterium]|nr:methyltransferase domain-containing protein [Gaiellaceae bacterium]
MASRSSPAGLAYPGALLRVLELPRVYLAWQRPFVAAKLAPIHRHNDLSAVRRVLDVGCGPGTNAALFDGKDYLGVDLDPEYVAHARRRHGDRFAALDLRSEPLPHTGTYDFVLLNSLLHHLDDEAVASLLAALPEHVSVDGHVHVVELELPERRGLPRLLARADRGRYARSAAQWRTLLTASFDEVVFEGFPVPGRGPTLWRMLYFKGRPRRR